MLPFMPLPISASATGLTASDAYDGRGWRKSKTVNGATTIYVAYSAHHEIQYPFST